jgi:hypothetical protein
MHVHSGWHNHSWLWRLKEITCSFCSECSQQCHELRSAVTYMKRELSNNYELFKTTLFWLLLVKLADDGVHYILTETCVCVWVAHRWSLKRCHGFWSIRHGMELSMRWHGAPIVRWITLWCGPMITWSSATSPSLRMFSSCWKQSKTWQGWVVEQRLGEVWRF